MFGRKKKNTNINTEISAENLRKLVEYTVESMKTDINENNWYSNIDIMFDYNGGTYIISIKYDKKTAKKNKLKEFSDSLVSYHFKKVVYQDIDSLFEKTLIDGMPLNSINEGIAVFPEMIDLLKGKGDLP